MIGEVYGNAAAGEKTLLERRIIDACIRNQNRSEALYEIRLGSGPVTEDGRFLDGGIERLGDGADLRDSGIGRGGAGGGTGSGGDASGGLATGDTLPAGNRVGLRGAAGHAGQGATSLGALEAPVRQDGGIAGDFDIDIVVQGK